MDNPLIINTPLCTTNEIKKMHNLIFKHLWNNLFCKKENQPKISIFIAII